MVPVLFSLSSSISGMAAPGVYTPPSTPSAPPSFSVMALSASILLVSLYPGSTSKYMQLFTTVPLEPTPWARTRR